MSRLLIISGESGAGKTTLANRLKRQGRGYVVNAGDVVWDMVTSAGLNPTSRVEAGLIFIEHFGAYALAPALRERLRAGGDVVVDGLRLPEAWTAISGMWSGCSTHIHIEVPMDVREARLLRRYGSAPPVEPFHDEIQWLKQRADLVLHNSAHSGDTILNSAQSGDTILNLAPVKYCVS